MILGFRLFKLFLVVFLIIMFLFRYYGVKIRYFFCVWFRFLIYRMCAYVVLVIGFWVCLLCSISNWNIVDVFVAKFK